MRRRPQTLDKWFGKGGGGARVTPRVSKAQDVDQAPSIATETVTTTMTSQEDVDPYMDLYSIGFQRMMERDMELSEFTKEHSNALAIDIENAIKELETLGCIEASHVEIDPLHVYVVLKQQNELKTLKFERSGVNIMKKPIYYQGMKVGKMTYIFTRDECYEKLTLDTYTITRDILVNVFYDGGDT